MKKIIFLVLFFISAGNCFAQQVTFQKTYGGPGDDAGYSVQQTMDGGYIITGSTNSFGSNDNVYLIKIDSEGNSLWTKTFGESGDDLGYCVKQTTDGGYIITGYTNSFGAGNFDVYLIKTDANGNTLWAKTFGGIMDDRGYSVWQTTDGGFIIGGSTISFGTAGSDVYLIKTNANGDSLWTKTFGGISDDVGHSVQQTTDGGYIIAGYTVSFGLSQKDVYLIKTDSSGYTLWSKDFEAIENAEAWSVYQTTDGGYITFGYAEQFFASQSDFYLIKTNSNGDTLWTRTFAGSLHDDSKSIQKTADGGYIITGYTQLFSVANFEAYLIKIDINGNLLWTKTFGGINYDSGNSVQQTTDGGYIVTGTTISFGAGSKDVYLIKTDSLGNSGCNEGNQIAFENMNSTQVTNPATIVTSPATIVTTPATIVGSGGTVTTLCTTVGIAPISNLQSSIFNISPNPATNNFTITFPNTINKGVIEIYNVLGVPINIGINENIVNVSQKEIQFENIEAGIYFVKVKDGEKEYCKKLVIE